MEGKINDVPSKPQTRESVKYLKDVAQVMKNIVIDKRAKGSVGPLKKTLAQTVMADKGLLPMQRGADLLPENRQVRFPMNFGPISSAVWGAVAQQGLMLGPSDPNSTSLTTFMGLKCNDQNTTEVEKCEEPKEEIPIIVPSEDLENI